MSDYMDSPSALVDGRLDLCDMYAFGGEEPGTTVLVLTVNPDAGKSSTTFHPEPLADGVGSGDDCLTGFPYLTLLMTLSLGLPPLVPREAG